MKTSILISSIAALGLLITFAGAPRRHGEDKMTLASTDNISFVTGNRVTMLPGLVITNYKKRDAGIRVPVIPADDFSYLKFDANEYMKTDASSLYEAEVLPEAIETDFGYLKFNINDLSSESELSGDEIMELPVSENNSSTPEPVVNEFDYLRFDAKEYLNSGTEVGELPLEEVKSLNQAEITIPGETKNDFSYLKFDVNKYYSSNSWNSDEQFEIPEE
jgi:hypothetical protein